MEGSSKVLGVHAIRLKSDVVTWPTDANGNRTEDKYCVQPGTYCGLVFLFSTVNGEPLALMNDGIIQHMRVGATGGLGAKHLARKDARIVGMLGSGGMARTYLEAFQAVRQLHECRVYSPTQKNREAFADEMSEKLGLRVIPVDTAEEAVRGADIVSTCTDAMQPVIKAEWLEPGMHVTNLQSDEWDPAMAERFDVLIRQGTSGLTPTADSARMQSGRGHSPFAYIAGTEAEMQRLPAAQAHNSRSERGLPDFTDLATGKVPGRTSPEQITGYLNSGNQGLQFAAAGLLAYQKAKAAGLGHELPTEMFLQDIRD
jgi:alanine dehydrogenase